MTKSTPFQLSRIYADGWIAGKKCNSDDLSEIAALADGLNPYRLLEEQERWSQGFKDAAQHGIHTPAASHRWHSNTGE